MRRRRENVVKSPLYKADLHSEISSIECAAGAIFFSKSPLYKADLHSEISSIEYAAGAKILQNRLSTERIYMLINSIECAAGAIFFCKNAPLQGGFTF